MKNLSNQCKNLLRDTIKILFVALASPAKEKGLQIVDTASWSIYQKYEYGNANYYDLISERLNESNQEDVLLSV